MEGDTRNYIAKYIGSQSTSAHQMKEGGSSGYESYESCFVIILDLVRSRSRFGTRAYKHKHKHKYKDKDTNKVRVRK